MQHRTHGNFHENGQIQCGTLEKKGVFGQALLRGRINQLEFNG